MLSLRRRGAREEGVAGLAFVLSALAVAGTAVAARHIVSQIISPPAVCSLVFTGIQRRHLMVWRVFAPKFVFSVSLAGAAMVGWAIWVARVLSSSSSSSSSSSNSSSSSSSRGARASNDCRRD
jgi:hypothetical protein